MLTRSPARRAAGANSLPLVFGAVILLAAAFALFSCRSLDWFFLKRSLRSQFDDVRWITTAALADWLANKDRPKPILLDVRTRAEWKVSHLPQATLVDPQTDPARPLAGFPKDTPIVTYCAAGYRSALAARRLQAAGFTRVWNLEGSIFQWANEDRALVRDGQIVTQVHPYSRIWGRLLEPKRRARPGPEPNDDY